MSDIALFEIQTIPGSSELVEALPYALDEDLRSLLPQMPGMRLGDIRSEWDLCDLSSDFVGKALPYWDQGTLEKMQKVGYRLFRDTNVQTAINTMIAFVVFKGWYYTIARQKDQAYTEAKLKFLRKAHTELVKSVSLGSQEGWYFLQKESYLRYLRDGEFFRRWWVRDGKLQVRFLEVHDVRQPPSRDNIDRLDQLPPEVLDQFDPNSKEVPGELGIITQAEDAATEIGFWHRVKDSANEKEQRFRFIPYAVCQHAKCGVDANDPRGIPAFYEAVCPAARAAKVDESMNELAVKQSEYAVVHKHKATNRRESIRALTDARSRELNDQVSGWDRRPNETHVKNVDIEMLGMSVKAENYIDIIQQGQRTIGGLRQLPEYMVTNDANTGNRSSLQTATSPFSRRVAMDQQDMWYYDEELQWNGLVTVQNYKEGTVSGIKQRVQINVSFPVAESKDPSKDADRLIKLREDQAISRQEQCKQLGLDYEQMKQEIEEEKPFFINPTKDKARGAAAKPSPLTAS